jgi:hypothetical protein
MRPLLIAALLITAACDKPQPPPEPTPTPQAPLAIKPPAPSEELAAPEETLADLTVSEWGMLMYPKQGSIRMMAGPRHPTPKRDKSDLGKGFSLSGGGAGVGLGKPVIYLKPGANFAPDTELSVKVSFPDGAKFHEVWPTPDNGPQPEHSKTFTWDKITLQAVPCSSGWAPLADAPACATLARPADCESAELEHWVPHVDRCLDVAGTPAAALLYSGDLDELKPPLTEVSVGVWRNDTDHPVGPLLVRHDGSLEIIERLAPGQQESTKPIDADALLWAIEQLEAQGLLEHEAQDFMRAWRTQIASKDWRYFGFFSAEAIEALSTLEVTPKPSKVVRVITFMQAR